MGGCSGTDSVYTTGTGSFLLGGKLQYRKLFSNVGYGLRNTTIMFSRLRHNKGAADGTSETSDYWCTQQKFNSDIETQPML